MRGFSWALFAAFTVAAYIPRAFADEPSTNTVASAGDAFGVTLGPESIGLYGPASIRGFSPLTAGNVRIDGLYFDLQGSMLDRLATDTRIRVGLSATGFPWPAPSGIVDYTLRGARATPEVTPIIYGGPYDSRDFDLDGSTPLLDERFEIAAGIAYHSDEFSPRLSAHAVSWAILPKWHPSSHITVTTFLGRQNVTAAKPQATIYLRPGQSLPPIPPNYFGPSWVNNENDVEHYGLLVKAEISPQWSVHLGLFHSTYDITRNFFDLYLDATSNGLADHELVVEPRQHYGSSSGEIQLSYEVSKATWDQEITFGARGRSVNARYGGADSVDFGVAPITLPDFAALPGYDFTPSTTDQIHDYSLGASYKFEWLTHLKIAAGLRRESYSDRVADPAVGSSTTSLTPWLYNLTAVFKPIHELAFYASLTRGMEDSGTAPMSATNRGQVLPATRSSQEEMGAMYTPSSSISVLAGVFDIDRSYFALDEHGDFDNLGQERHRGFEFSLTGALTPTLRIVAGALLMTPEVLPKSAPGEVIGSLPIGQPRRIIQVCLDYRPKWMPSVSFDGVFSNTGSRVASLDNRVRISGVSNLDLGARYHFSLDHHSLTLRIQVFNVNNSLSWGISNDGGLSRTSARRAWAYLMLDF